MKAKHFYHQNELYLSVPKQGHAAMLFMEWCCQFKRGKSLIDQFLNDTNTDSIFIRLNLTKAQADEAVQYINANL
jgi:hypothetical protein